MVDPVIQLPNSPSETVIPDYSSSSSSMPWRSIIVGVMVLGVVGTSGYAFWSVKKATDNYQKNLSKRSDEISAILDEKDSGFSLVGEAQASYENPIEDDSYSNPFEADENPFEDK